jgi:hypothetical protein
MKKIASNGKQFYNLNFNSSIVSKFIVDKTFKINKKDRYIWD